MTTRLKWKRKSFSTEPALKRKSNVNIGWIKKKKKHGPEKLTEDPTDNVKWVKKKSNKELKVEEVQYFFNFFQAKGKEMVQSNVPWEVSKAVFDNIFKL